MSGLKTLLRLMTVLVFVLSASLAAAQQAPPYGPSITLDAAKKIAAAAIAEAKKNNWRVAIAIVDTYGFLVYYERLDDTQTAGPQFAVEKARTAAMYRRSTKSLEDRVKAGEASVISFPWATPVTGGLPILSDGKVIGGIGSSGVASDQDEQIARAGLAGLK